MSEALLTWSEWTSELDQTHQVNDLAAVDVGFGNFLVASLRGGIATPHKRHDAIRAFYARQVKSWVKLTNQSDPKEFIIDLMQQAKTTLNIGADKAANPLTMPIVFFTRMAGVSVASGEIYAPVKRLANIGDTVTGKPLGRVNLHHEAISYVIGVCAWDMPTLDFMTRLLSARFRHHTTGFAFEAELAGLRFPASADLMTKTLIWDPASPPAETDRLLCLTSVIEVIAEAHEFEGLESKEIHYRLMDPSPLFEVSQ
ncbi:MAG: hypothetical protein ACRC9V_07785 [Aeromonas sp.]